MVKHLNSIINIINKGPEIEFISDIEFNSRIWILGAGKASVAMAAELSEQLPHPPYDGLIISTTQDYLDNIQIFRGTHPYPSDENIAASYELLDLAKSIPEGDIVFFCMSGGASSLLTIPPFGIEMKRIGILFQIATRIGS